jgi:hypothetical protein
MFKTYHKNVFSYLVFFSAAVLIVLLYAEGVRAAGPAVTATLSANPISVVAGGSSTLTWSSTNATSCTGTNFLTSNATSSAASVTPGSDTTYSVSCTNGTTTASSSATVRVTPSMPNLYNAIGAGSNITAGQSANLTATTYNNGGGSATNFNDTFYIYDSSYAFVNANGSTNYATTNPVVSGTINPAANQPRTGTYTFLHPGVFYTRLFNDSGGNIVETDKTDNWSNNGFAQIRVKPTPPTGLNFSCNNAVGDSATFSWDPTDGAKGYYVRLFDNSTRNYNGYSDGYSATTVVYPMVPGDSYTFSVISNASASADYDITQYSDASFLYSVTCAALPDLAAVTNGPMTVLTGQSATYTGTVKNAGTVPIPGNYDTYAVFYSDAGATTHVANPYTSFAGRGPALGLGNYNAVSAPYTFTAPGTYYYRFCTDWNNEIAESKDSVADAAPYLNCGAIQTVRVNLAPLPPTGLTYSCNSPTSVTLLWTGSASATAYDIRLYDGVSPGSSNSHNLPGYPDITDNWGGTSITYNNIVSGRTYSDWQVDAINASGTSTPTHGTGFTCGSQPDARASTGFSEAITLGVPHTFSGTVTNNGSATLGASQALFQVCSVGSPACFDFSQSANTAEAALAPGSSTPVSVSFTLPAYRNDYMYRVCANIDKSTGNIIQPESNNANNCGSWVTVTLAPASIPPPPPTGLTYTCSSAGDSITLAWNAAAGASGYYIKLQDGVSPSSSNSYNQFGYPDITDNYPYTTITYSIVPGRSYIDWQVASGNSYSQSAGTHGAAFSCTGQADVTAATGVVGQTETAAMSQPHTFSGTVTNNGSVGIPASQALFQFCDISSSCTNYNQKANVSEASLAPGASAPVSYAFTLPASPTDLKYRVCANLNATDMTAIKTESNYGNNCGDWNTINVVAAFIGLSASATSGTIGDTITYTINSVGGTAPYAWSDSRVIYSGTTTTNSFAITYGDPQNDSGAHIVTVMSANSVSTTSPIITIGGGYCTSATPVLSISALPNRVAGGLSANLTWSASGLNGKNQSCSIASSPAGFSLITPPAGAPPSCSIPNGSASPTINRKTTFTITCGGSSTSTDVNVIPTFKEF